ncbi:MAG: NVEALA domain-containing protein [Bacteroidaceae bacterium]|nr:NVEALA domain-containing protein [Bacteroidaceae bacterium]
MKRFMLCAVVLFAAVAGYNCYNNSSASDDEMSDLMKANVKALASQPDPYKQKVWYVEPFSDGSGHVCVKGGSDSCL